MWPINYDQMVRFFILFCLLLLQNSAIGQTKYTCRTAHVNVKSANRFMDIIADNYQVYSQIDAVTGAVSFTGLMRSFDFKLGALDQAFNSSKVDLGPYTKFNFDGKILNYKALNLSRPGSYSVEVDGMLSIGEQKRKTRAKGTVVVNIDRSLRATTKFNMRIEQESMNKINDLMRKKLPAIVALDTDKLGISRDVLLSLSADYKVK